jgi:hypothetical protein
VYENGNKSIAPIILKTHSKVKPTILKGKVISQINGKRSRNSKAKGQHKTKRIHQSTKEINTCMLNYIF